MILNDRYLQPLLLLQWDPCEKTVSLRNNLTPVRRQILTPSRAPQTRTPKWKWREEKCGDLSAKCCEMAGSWSKWREEKWCEMAGRDIIPLTIF